MGVEFSGFDTPSIEMTLRAYVYFDGLTKDTFIQRVLLTIRAVALAIRTFVRALEEQSRSKHVLSPEELTKITRLVPATGGRWTLAS
jgi:hypothetical protein